MTTSSGITGRRVLVVEDDSLIALLVESMLSDLGASLVGPAGSVSEALRLIDSGVAFDVALLDLNLEGLPVYPVADLLRARNAPFIYCTGYGEAGLRPEDRAVRLLRKPYRIADLAQALEQVPV
ncbi:MAG: response regulator [Alphaproteobacteria bacterium]|nr:response regulator [Alphaproteobacteria bacterium]